MGHRSCWPVSSVRFLGCGTSSRMAVMLETSSRAVLPNSVSGPSRSSRDPIPPRGSNCCRAAGWSSGPSHGSAGTGVLQKTSNKPSPRQPHGSLPPPSSSSLAGSQSYEITSHSFESDSYHRPACISLAALIARLTRNFILKCAVLAQNVASNWVDGAVPMETGVAGHSPVDANRVNAQALTTSTHCSDRR